MTTEGVRGLAEVLAAGMTFQAFGGNPYPAVSGPADEIAERAFAWFDARLGSGEVVEAVARILDPGAWWDTPGAAHDRERDKTRARAAAAVEAVRAALREGEA